MTNLEFIEKEIDTYKQLKEQAILRISDEDDEVQLYLLQRRINLINERLPILQQIKDDLEAWEKVKKLIGVVEVPKQNPFMGNVWTENYLYFITNPYITKETAVIIKKALEVNNNGKL